MSNRPLGNAGGGAWTLFIDAVDEAQARGAKSRKRRIGRRKLQLQDLETKHIKLAEQVRRRLERQLVDKGPDWIPDPEFIAALDTAAKVVQQMARSLRLGAQAEREAMRGMTNDQLDGVMLTHLKRVASEFDEDTWRALLVPGMGEDIAEAAISLWRQREAECKSVAEAGSARTQFKPKESTS